MATIKVRVNGEIATNITPEVRLVCQNDKYDIEFEFDESWANSNVKTALFIYNGKVLTAVFDRELDKNVCKIPSLYDTELLHIGVKSDDVEGLHTTTPAKVGCLLSANDLTSDKIPEPSKNVYDEIIALLNNYISFNPLSEEEVIEIADNIASEKIDNLINGADEAFDTLKEIADWIKEHPNSIIELNSKIQANSDKILANEQAIININKLVSLLAEEKQNKSDENLITVSKEIVGAINEVKTLAETAKMIFGETEGTAYEGNKGKANADNIKKLQNKLASVNMALTQSGLVKKYKQPNTQEYNERVTADGLNVLDGSKAVLKKVVGNTVRCKNLFNPDKLLAANGWTEKNGIYSGLSGALHPVYNSSSGVSIIDDFKENTQYTLSFYGQTKEYDGYKQGIIVSFVYTDGTRSELIMQDAEETKYILISTAGKTVQGLYFSYGASLMTYLRDIQCEQGSTATEYVPYFTGLKNASFQGIKSTGKNLFDLTDALNSSKWYYNGGSHFYPLNLMAGKQYTLSGEVVKLLSEYSGFVANSRIDIVRKQDVNSFSFTSIYDIENVKKDFNFSFEAQGNEYLFIYAGGTYPAQTLTLVNAYLNEIIQNLQIEYGSTATAYEPYTENTLELPEEVDCGLGTTIDFENKKIVNSGKTIVLTGEEAWVVDKGYTVESGYYSSMYCIGLLTGRENRAYGIATDGYVAHSLDEISYYGNGFWWVGVNEAVLYILGAERYFGFTQFADPNNPTTEEGKTLKSEWIAFLKQRYADGNPVTIRYVSSTSKETPFTSEQSAVGNEYTAHKDGLETVLGNSNQEFGAENTLTQDYILITAVE